MSHPQEPETFAPHVVCRTLELSQGTLNAWFHHGYLRNLDCAGTVAGKARRFTVEDLLSLAIIQRLTDFGFDVARAAFYASEAIDAFDAHPDTIHRLIVWQDDGGPDGWRETMGFNDDHAPPGAVVTLNLDLVELFAAVKRRHKTVMS